MTQPLGEKTITPNISGSFSGPSTGIKGLLIGNESPFTVDIKLDGQGTGKTLYPETVDFFAAGPQFNGVVIFKTRALLLNPTSYTASFLSFEAVGKNESLDTGAYPMALTRQAVSSTASGDALFTATIGFGATASLKQILNIFNPANSGVTYTFHSARCFTNDATTPTVNLAFVPGADSNLGTAVPAVSHDGSATPRLSTAHCTSVDQAGGIIGANPIMEVMNMQQNVTQDMLQFPDNETLSPGGNMVMELSAGAGGHVVRLTLKWSENSKVPGPGLSGASSVLNNVLTAQNLANIGLPIGSTLINSIPQGQGSASWLVTNDGQATLRALIAGVYHTMLKFSAVGNPLQLGQAGDIAEFLGQLQVDAAMNLNPTGLVDNGSTSGTATLYQLLVGNVKLVVVFQNNFQNAGAAINRALPTAFTKHCLIWAKDVAGISLLASNVVQNVSRYTAIGAAGFTGTANATINGATLNEGVAFDTVQYTGGNAGAHNGVMVIIGG